MNYTYTIDLRNQDTTPSYVVTYVSNGATISYPANKMPHLNADDTITFNFQFDKGTAVVSCSLYVRAIVNSELNSPFEPQNQPGGQYVIGQGTTLGVVANNGLWTFSILGMMSVPSLAEQGPDVIHVPFFIDPDMDVGSGVPP